MKLTWLYSLLINQAGSFVRSVCSSVASRMNTSLVLLACSQLFFGTMVTMTPDCWYRAEFCRVDGQIPDKLATRADQVLACYQQCYGSSACMEFTFLFSSEGSGCYLFNEPCERIHNDPCISQGCCVSGPRDCVESPVKDCSKSVNSGSEYMSWQCINHLGGKFDAYEAAVPAGSVCYLS